MVGVDGDLAMLIHLMSAGRLQLYDTRASLRDRTSRLLVRLDDGRELRLREFGTKQAAWVKLLTADALEAEETIATLGPEAWPDPPDLGPLLGEPRPLHGILRDQRVIAGIGRSWVDEILHDAQLSPFKRGSDLSAQEAERLREAIVRQLGRAIAHYEEHPHAAHPGQAADAAARPPAQRGALPALRRPVGGGLLRGLRDVLLPRLPDRRQAAQGPAAVAAAEVGSRMADILGTPDLPVFAMRNRGEFEAARGQTPDRIAYEEFLQRGYAHVEEYRFPAFCHACGQPSGLLADRQYGWDREVNFRERLQCPRCQLNTRQRFMAHLVIEEVRVRAPRPRVYLHEQVTPFYEWASRSLSAEVVGSEYLGPDVAGGAVINGVRHEDALALSFPDGAFDVIVSQDVFEHVPSIESAIDETARVLAPQGRFLLSVPFDPGADATVQRARLVDGEVEHLLEPAVHGNPLSPEGSLVFYDHGWDLLDRLRHSGFADVSVLGVWSTLYGYLGGGMVIVISATRA